jgi:polysaccharide biosynthesis transport protein
MSSFLEKQIDELKAKMEQSSLALAQYEKDLDVVNPEEKTNILSARLLQLNTDYTTAQADRIRADAIWNSVKSGSIEAAQASSQADLLNNLTDALNKARQHFALVKATYESSHPEYRKAASELAEVQKEYDNAKQGLSDKVEAEAKESENREQLLRAALADAKAEWDNINAKSFQYQRLKQEADTDKALYDELIKKIREGDINAGFQNNNIRIADLARPSFAAISPNISRNLLWALAFSVLVAIATAILFDSLDSTLRDPQEASRFLDTDVIATMPSDRVAAQLPRPLSAIAGLAKAEIVPRESNGNRRNGYGHSASAFDEAVRALRNTILLSDFEGRLHSIVLTSAVPGEGKSTLAAHLAIASADRGKRTLLVDGDLRRPSLHSKFGLSPREGLANVLNGELPWQEVVIPIEGELNLSLLPAGLGSHRAADLIGPRLANLLDDFGKEYDLVILDSPPLLGFAECLQMAAAGDGVLITSRAGKTRRRAVAEVIRSLRRVHANIIGVALNQVSRHTSAEGYSYYGHYGYGNSRYRDAQQAQADS